MSKDNMNTDQQPVEITFVALILAFSSAALSNMGYKAFASEQDNGSQRANINLSLAKQNIDILEILREKTKGNLTEDEENLFKDILIDLKIKFAEASKN